MSARVLTRSAAEHHVSPRLLSSRPRPRPRRPRRAGRLAVRGSQSVSFACPVGTDGACDSWWSRVIDRRETGRGKLEHFAPIPDTRHVIANQSSSWWRGRRTGVIVLAETLAVAVVVVVIPFLVDEAASTWCRILPARPPTTTVPPSRSCSTPSSWRRSDAASTYIAVRSSGRPSGRLTVSEICRPWRAGKFVQVSSIVYVDGGFALIAFRIENIIYFAKVIGAKGTGSRTPIFSKFPSERSLLQ